MSDNHESVHNYLDTEDQIPPSPPLQKGGIPLFRKEGLGEIFGRICLLNYGLLSKSWRPAPSQQDGLQDHDMVNYAFFIFSRRSRTWYFLPKASCTGSTIFLNSSRSGSILVTPASSIFLMKSLAVSSRFVLNWV